MTDFTTPSDLSQFKYEVPEFATIPADTPFIQRRVDEVWAVYKEGSVFDLVPKDRTPGTYWTMEPVTNPLPTEVGTTVVAHTATQPKRRIFMYDGDPEAAGWHSSTGWDYTEDLIDPVPLTI